MKKHAVGVIGLGKMGKNIAMQLISKGYEVVAWNRSPAPLEEVVAHGARKAATYKELVEKLGHPAVVWVMLPAGEVTNDAVRELSDIMGKGDILIDGSNSEYTAAIWQNEVLSKKGIEFLDAGCSGGPSGALHGMSIMVGGEEGTFRKMEQLFKDVSVEDGYAYMGPSGSGHFVKMVHNAIEYGIMQSIAEGMDLLANGPYKELDLGSISHVWNHGSVIRGYLMELTERALKKDPRLGSIKPYVDDTGEGRWASQTAIQFGVPFTTISHSLYERFSSRSEYRFNQRLLAALRHEFGGHEVKKE